MNIGKFKIGDIVVIKSHEKAPPGWRKNAPLNLVTEIIGKGYGQDKIFKILNDREAITNYPDIRFRYATGREKFLYYILGPHVLEGE